MAEGDLSLGTAVPQILDILDQPNGFDIAAALELAESTDFVPPKDFRFKPLIAMVTGHAERLSNSVPIEPDGSVLGCDVLLPKPLTVDRMRVLIEGCCV